MKSEPWAESIQSSVRHYFVASGLKLVTASVVLHKLLHMGTADYVLSINSILHQLEGQAYIEPLKLYYTAVT